MKQILIFTLWDNDFHFPWLSEPKTAFSIKQSLFNPFLFSTAKSLYDAFYGFNTLYLAFMRNFTAYDFNYSSYNHLQASSSCKALTIKSPN